MLKKIIISTMLLYSSFCHAATFKAPLCFSEFVVFDESEDQFMGFQSKVEIDKEELILYLAEEYKAIGMDVSWISEISDEISSTFHNSDKINFVIVQKGNL